MKGALTQFFCGSWRDIPGQHVASRRNEMLCPISFLAPAPSTRAVRSCDEGGIAMSYHEPNNALIGLAATKGSFLTVNV